MTYYAHSKEGQPREKWQPLKEHLMTVAKKAKEFASAFGLGDEARIAGLLHDFGKYSHRFQQRLSDASVTGINHWSSGAYIAKEMGCRWVPFTIEGHHTGMPAFRRDDPRRSLRNTLLGMADPGMYTEITGFPESADALMKRLRQDGLEITPHVDRRESGNFADAFQTRMIFSTLVDADYLDTERFMDPEIATKRVALPLNADVTLSVLLAHLAAKPKEGTVNILRRRLLDECLYSAEWDEWLYTLTAPTGSGKTLASLAFALRKAQLKGCQRIISIIPYTTIIEQTARIYRDVFAGVFGSAYVLEHHSNVSSDGEADSEAYDPHSRRHLAAENWDAPIIVTTTVQFFESLFSNRPSACRKLHRIANSVLLFDEVQTLPIRLLPSLLSGVKLLTEKYNVVAVFGTATQPAFAHAKQAISGGWNPQEIATAPDASANELRRIQITRRPSDKPQSWQEIAGELLQQTRVLCVVNSRKDAQTLFELIHQNGAAYHLSAAMCAAHRQDRLHEIRERLTATDLPCRLIATQLIEAGVDIDFPVVYRALGPLDSIIQSAGRCNREGLIAAPASVVVFVPADGTMPCGCYRQAAAITEAFLNENPGIDLQLPSTYAQYFGRMYGILGPESAKQDPVFVASEEFDFPAAAAACSLIGRATRSVLVDYREGRQIIEEIEKRHVIDFALARRSQRYTINLYEGAFQKAYAEGVVAPLTRKADVYCWRDKYDANLGACHYSAVDLIVG
ncbi:MAG: CRISPR-associated helicase Cas3' [Kiritimatiellae bacterium]|nr:CRISPR-associated helicase Cas3' [Kiritimatiellia bacterium]